MGKKAARLTNDKALAEHGVGSIDATTRLAQKAFNAWLDLAEEQRTPARLIAALQKWPLVSAPMAEQLTGSSRAAVQRNLVWMEAQGLIREVTGQGRFRMWKAA